MEWGSGFAVLLAGWLIGATGIGGVLVVPVLTAFDGMEPARAIAAAAWAFAFPGAAALLWLRRDPRHAQGLGALMAGAVPGTLAGAALVHAIDSRLLLAGVAALALASGIRGLVPRSQPASESAALAALPMAMLGFAVGVGSALTGTGGPVLLVPLLMMLRQPLARCVAAAQAIQLPLALCATAVHWASGALDLKLGVLLGVVLLAGSLAGQWAARRIPLHHLQVMVCLLLVAVGGWLGWQALVH